MPSYLKLFTALYSNKIEYLVAGGMAVNFHQVNRATYDLDLILHLTTENISKFIKIVSRLGFKPRLPVDAKDLANTKIRQSWINEKNMTVFSFFHEKNPFETIDVFVNEPKPFNKLQKKSLDIKIDKIKIYVLGIDDLIELKKISARDKDLYDITQLEKIKKEKKNLKSNFTEHPRLNPSQTLQ